MATIHLNLAGVRRLIFHTKIQRISLRHLGTLSITKNKCARQFRNGDDTVMLVIPTKKQMQIIPPKTLLLFILLCTSCWAETLGGRIQHRFPNLAYKLRHPRTFLHRHQQDKRLIELSIQFNAPKPTQQRISISKEGTVQYKTVGRISLSNDGREKDDVVEVENNTEQQEIDQVSSRQFSSRLTDKIKSRDSSDQSSIPKTEDAMMEEAMGNKLLLEAQCQELIQPIVAYLLEDEVSHDIICAFCTTCPDDLGTGGSFEVNGIIGTFRNDQAVADISVAAQKSTTAECLGCLSDLIVLKLPSELNRKEDDEKKASLSEGEIQKIMNSLMSGIERRINARENQHASFPITTILVQSEGKQTKYMEQWIHRQIKEELSERNITPDQCHLEIMPSRNSIEEFDFKCLLRHDDDEEKPVPMHLFPKLVQSVSSIFMGDFGGKQENTTEDELVSFCHVFKSSILEKSDESTISASSSPKEPPKQSEKVIVTASLSHEMTSSLEQAVLHVLKESKQKLMRLESKQDDATLRGGMPILEFGKDATSILEEAGKTFDSIFSQSVEQMTSSEKKVVEEKRKDMMFEIAYGSTTTTSSPLDSNLSTLYYSQLSALREYYGRKYETMLDKKEEDDSIDMNEVAGQCSEGFKTAAVHAIPNQCRLGQELYLDTKNDEDILPFEYLSNLNGLLQDMLSGLEDRSGMEQDWASAIDDNDEDYYDEDGEVQRKRPMTWYQKLGARLLVMGVNYGQGWLALQGIKRAAAERDRNMPKFPLF